jgi:hypothetical protein
MGGLKGALLILGEPLHYLGGLTIILKHVAVSKWRLVSIPRFLSL